MHRKQRCRLRGTLQEFTVHFKLVISANSPKICTAEFDRSLMAQMTVLYTQRHTHTDWQTHVYGRLATVVTLVRVLYGLEGVVNQGQDFSAH